MTVTGFNTPLAIPDACLEVSQPGHPFTDLWTPARAVGDGTYEPANALDDLSASMAFALVQRKDAATYCVYSASGRYEWPSHGLGGVHGDLWLADAGGFAFAQGTQPQRMGQIDGPDHIIWNPFDMLGGPITTKQNTAFVGVLSPQTIAQGWSFAEIEPTFDPYGCYDPALKYCDQSKLPVVTAGKKREYFLTLQVPCIAPISTAFQQLRISDALVGPATNLTLADHAGDTIGRKYYTHEWTTQNWYGGPRMQGFFVNNTGAAQTIPATGSGAQTARAMKLTVSYIDIEI